MIDTDQFSNSKITTVIKIENTNSTTEYRIKNDKTVHVRTVRR